MRSVDLAAILWADSTEILISNNFWLRLGSAGTRVFQIIGIGVFGIGKVRAESFGYESDVVGEKLNFKILPNLLPADVENKCVNLNGKTFGLLDFTAYSSATSSGQ
jgi:hypothetical protein